MNYVIYLYMLSVVVVTTVGSAVLLWLPIAGIYYLVTKLCKQRKWVGIVTSVLFGILGSGYLYATVYSRYMDHVYATIGSMMS